MGLLQSKWSAYFSWFIGDGAVKGCGVCRDSWIGPFTSSQSFTRFLAAGGNIWSRVQAPSTMVGSQLLSNCHLAFWLTSFYGVVYFRSCWICLHLQSEVIGSDGTAAVLVASYLYDLWVMTPLTVIEYVVIHELVHLHHQSQAIQCIISATVLLLVILKWWPIDCGFLVACGTT